MPWTPTITAQGSPSVESHSDRPSRAPSKLTTALASSLGPENPSGGRPACCTRSGVQADSATAARIRLSVRIIGSKLNRSPHRRVAGGLSRHERPLALDQLGERRAL